MKIKVIGLTILAIIALILPLAVVNPVSADGSLILENKDTSTWTIIQDGRSGSLTYNASGTEFVFNLSAVGMENNVPYSLIYYADPDSGNHPGALIGVGTSSVAGVLNIAGSINLNMDLPTAPDSNMIVPHPEYSHQTGAKIWVVPSDCYNVETKQVTVWSFDRFLLETDLISYTDTNKPVAGTTPLTTNVLVTASTIGLSVSPVEGLNFGSVSVGSCSGNQVLTLTNTGTVPIKVTAIPSTGFYATSLWLGDVLATSWTSVVIPATDPDTSITVNAKVCPVPGLTGVVTGSVGFMASFAQ